MMKINNINFYKSKQKWKYALFILAIIISSLSIILTSELEKSLEESISSLSLSIETLKREESENMDNFPVILFELALSSILVVEQLIKRINKDNR